MFFYGLCIVYMTYLCCYTFFCCVFVHVLRFVICLLNVCILFMRVVLCSRFCFVCNVIFHGLCVFLCYIPVIFLFSFCMFLFVFRVFILYKMVFTRKSQQSTEPTEVESINKLIAKRKEEKRKKKNAKLVEKETTSNRLDNIKE